MKRKAFTVTELLVVITLIMLLSGMSWGALHSARQTGCEAATRATIAKLHSIVMERYESYYTRRIPVSIIPCPGQWLDGTPLTDAERRQWMQSNHWKRLRCIRDIIRMEMPDAKSDIDNGPIAFQFDGVWHDPQPDYSVSEPALHLLYKSNPPTATHDPAQCLFLFVSMACPEAMEQFRRDEIGMVDGKRVFIDGWGMPIKWLRWAPGYTSPIQSGVEATDHDQFDPRKIDAFAFRMIPLIYSATGKRKADGDPQYGIEVGTGAFTGNPYANMDLGKIIAGEGGEGIITNHNIEQR